MEDRPALSLEYVRVSASAIDEDGAAVDPTVDSVALAFVTEGTAVTGSTTFISGTWETNDADVDNPIYYARVLVGPLPDGDYVPVAGTSIDVYIRVTDNPEAVVRHAGTMRFT